MEDTYSIKDRFGGDASCALFAIFDGHGGKSVSEHCAERMHEELRKEVVKTPGDFCQSLERVFLKIDDELRLLDSEGCGSTATVCMIRNEYGHRVIYTANVGDSRAVLLSNGAAKRMTVDHRPSE